MKSLPMSSWEPTALLDALDESVTVYSRDAVVLYANPATFRIFGRELTGKCIWDVFPEAVGSEFYQAFHRVLARGGSEQADHYYPVWDRWFRNQIVVVGDHLHVVAHDVTEHKLGEVRLRALARASQAFARTVELAPLCEAIAQSLAELVGDACIVRVIEGDELTPVAVHHSDPQRQDSLRAFFAKPLAKSEGLSAKVLATGDPLLIERVESSVLRSSFHGDDHRAGIDRGAPHSVIATALTNGKERVGVITMLRDRTPRPYTRNDLSLLQDLSERASMAMARVRLFEQSQLDHRRAIVISDASRAFSAAEGDTRAILDLLARAAAAEVGEIAVANVITDDGHRLRPVAFHSNAELTSEVQDLLGRETPLAGSFSERVIATGKSVRLTNLDVESFVSSTTEKYAGMVRKFQPKSFMMVPLRRAQRVLGMLAVSRTASAVPYSDTDESLLEELADRAALAVDSSRVLAAERLARQSAERVAAQTRRLQAIASELSDRRPTREVAETILRESTTVLGDPVGTGAIWLVDDNRNCVMLASVGYETPQRYSTLPLDAAIPLCTAVRTETPLYLANVKEYAEQFPESAKRLGSDAPAEFATACLPLISEGRAIGGLVFAYPYARTFIADERTFIEVLASQCAQAIDRARLLEQERAASEAARAADRRKDEFLAMLGHELRNPLAPIMTALELMRLRNENSNERERAMIERQTRHLVRLVDDLLDISRITRGKIELHKHRVDLGSAIGRAVEMASPLLEQRNHHVSIAAPRGLVYVDGDEFRLAQVFQNLLTNAAKYTPSGGSITVRLTTNGTDAVAEIEDNGVGISSGALSTIFDPFVQGAQNLDRSQGGLGIGLTLVRSLVELHDGHVEAHSEGPGLGSRFSVTLPLSAGMLREAQRTPQGMAPIRATRRRVLLVDDNRDAAEMLAELLRSAGHEVVVAFDGPSALRTLPVFTPEVALLDIGLPVMDGYDLARRLKDALPATPRLVAISGYGQEHDRQRSRAAGFDAHLVKPVQAEQVLAAVDDPVS
ncbi:MAG TPA: GAF domain-containing protein [Kofleriaceae bacterium]